MRLDPNIIFMIPRRSGFLTLEDGKKRGHWLLPDQLAMCVLMYMVMRGPWIKPLWLSSANLRVEMTSPIFLDLFRVRVLLVEN